MMRNIEFKRVNTIFQSTLNKDINMINNVRMLFTRADKSNNLYKFSRDTYRKLLQDNIRISYTKSNVTLISSIKKKQNLSQLNLNSTIE